MTTPDELAALLAPIRADLRAAADGGLSGIKAGDYLPAALARHTRDLLAAVEAALALPAEWRRESEALRDAAGKVWEDAPDAPGVRLKHAYAAGYAECAKALEAATAAALAGKEAGDA